MAMTIEWFGVADRDRRDEPFGAGMAVDAPLRAVLDKKDDRLLRDAGLTRANVLGEEAFFRREWSRLREPWAL